MALIRINNHPALRASLQRREIKSPAGIKRQKLFPSYGGVPGEAGGVAFQLKKPQKMSIYNSKTEDVFIGKTKIIFQPIIHLPTNSSLSKRAKELRQAGNLPEVLFWMQVHKAKFHRIDFDRQKVIGNYIVDFYVKKLGLIIEIDGASHDDKEKYDEKREFFLTSLGLKIYRISVYDIMKRMNYVILELEDFIIRNYGELPPCPAGIPPKEGN